MSRLWYTPSGKLALCSNGKVALTDECPCCGYDCSQTITIPATEKILAIGAELPPNVPIDTPLYSTFQDCIDATDSMSEESFTVYVNGGSYADEVTANEKQFVFIGIGSVTVTGYFITNSSSNSRYFKNIALTVTREEQVWYANFINCTLDFTTSTLTDSLDSGDCIVYAVSNCSVNIVTENGVDGQVLLPSYPTTIGEAGGDSGDIRITKVICGELSLKTGNAGSGKNGEGVWSGGGEGGDSGVISISYACSCDFTQIKSGNGGNGGKGGDVPAPTYTERSGKGGSGGVSGQINSTSDSTVNYYSIVVGNGGDGGDGGDGASRTAANSGAAGWGGSVGAIGISGQINGISNIYSLDIGTAGVGGTGGKVGLTLPPFGAFSGSGGTGGSGGSARLMGTCNVYAPINGTSGGDGGNSGDAEPETGGTAGKGGLGGVIILNASIFSGAIILYLDASAGNGGNGGNAVGAAYDAGSGADGGVGGYVELEGNITFIGALSSGDGGDGGDGGTGSNSDGAGGNGANGGYIEEIGVDRGILGSGGTGGAGSPNGLDGLDGEYKP